MATVQAPVPRMAPATKMATVQAPVLRVAPATVQLVNAPNFGHSPVWFEPIYKVFQFLILFRLGEYDVSSLPTMDPN